MSSIEASAAIDPLTEAVPPLLIIAQSLLVAMLGVRARSQLAVLSQSPSPVLVHVMTVGVGCAKATPAGIATETTAAAKTFRRNLLGLNFLTLALIRSSKAALGRQNADRARREGPHNTGGMYFSHTCKANFFGGFGKLS